eukprot:TRINITY_DN12280_c0_g2_i2.p1 TRINITY_DN12280_c0_g2~~TRINITY_DN12280_c0_g2_i2.p1  ORF type:complete len:717 (-),score=102.50 TRINITY_DN12280_c0_g2_i2:192-2342(-)
MPHPPLNDTMQKPLANPVPLPSPEDGGDSTARSITPLPPWDARLDKLEKELHQALERISQLESSNFERPLELDLHGQKTQPTVYVRGANVKEGILNKEKSAEAADESGGLKADDRHPSVSLATARDHLTEMARENNGYEIKANCWEASILIGEASVGWAGSLFLSLGMLLSVISDFTFIYVLTFTPAEFVNSSRPSNEALKEWRYTEGHDQKNMLGPKSLLAAVCEVSPLLSMASAQAALVRDMNGYESVEFSSGAVLAMLVILMWFLLVTSDVKECCQFVLALLRLKRGRKTEFSLMEDTEQIVIDQISYARVGLIILLQAFRLTIACALFVVGALWLAAEINIEALVLNAAALGFVLDVDEVLYNHFAPDVAKLVIQNTAPLPGPSSSRLTTRNVGPCAMAILSMTTAAFYFFFLVLPQVRDIRLAKTVLCGGDQDFVFIDYAFFPQTASAEAHYSESVIERTNHFKVDFLSNYADRDASSPPTWLDTSELHEAVAAGPLSLYPRRCEDHPDLRRVKLRLDVVDFVPFFQAFTGNLDAVSCEALHRHCYAPNSFWVRNLCPKTCGCDIYRGELWVRTGCPQTCEENENFWDQERSRPCENPNKTWLQNDPVWVAWWVGNWTPWYTAQWPEGFAAQRVPGCELLEHGSEAGLLPELLCAHGDAALFSGSLRIFCPETCGCNQSPHLDGCPMSCASRHHVLSPGLVQASEQPSSTR